MDEYGSRLVRSVGQLYVLDVHMGLTDALTVGHYPDMNMKINTESPRLAATPVNDAPQCHHLEMAVGRSTSDICFSIRTVEV